MRASPPTSHALDAAAALCKCAVCSVQPFELEAHLNRQYEGKSAHIPMHLMLQLLHSAVCYAQFLQVEAHAKKQDLHTRPMHIMLL